MVWQYVQLGEMKVYDMRPADARTVLVDAITFSLKETSMQCFENPDADHRRKPELICFVLFHYYGALMFLACIDFLR